MKLMFIFVGVFLLNSILCYESGSFESSLNAMESLPFYDTIIFSDIADIMKEFETSSVPIFNKIGKDESESEETFDDLLLEYQDYLDKEHKQRKDYIERTKLKNKVPLLRHDRYSKTNFGNGGKYNDHLYKNGFYNLQNTYKSKNPIDFFVPVKPEISHYNTMELSTTLPRDNMELNTFKKIIQSEEGRAPSYFPEVPFKAPCCQSGQMPCKQCTSAKDSQRSRLEPRFNIATDEKISDNLDNKVAGMTDFDDDLNIRIKIDVQLPKLHDKLDKYQNTFGPDDGSNMREFPLAIKMPSSYYNFPVPMNLFGYKRISKSYFSPLHNLSNKKKKSTAGKKHRKKIISFHNIKMNPQQIYDAHFGKNTSEGIPDITLATDATDLTSSTTDILETNYSSTTTERLEEHVNVNESQTEENIFMVVNITNNVSHDTEEFNKTNNSIESEYMHPKLNVTKNNDLHLRRKRDVLAVMKKLVNDKTIMTAFNKTVTELSNETTTAANVYITLENNVITLNKTAPKDEVKESIITISKASKDFAKNVDKNLFFEDELLYWPNKNGSQNKVLSKNITTIILENETKKGKLNISKESMRNNHTRALERAIFGDVDWNDVCTVAPGFMTFFGKYMDGALTFCSDVICHSIKCGQKVCQNRVCTPSDRFNNRGHCMGSNNNDSVATMESIMDLPSNIVFEIVDILQDKMAGKMFGKVTLCINSKCITFASSKKLFVKYKCTGKELNPNGHCVNTKEGKIA